MKIRFSILMILATNFSGCLIDHLKMVANPAYAIGTIDYYKPGGGLGVDSDIHFHYSIAKVNYKSNYDDGDHRWSVPWSCGNCSNGNKFMVQYDSLQPSLARMLFSYQVTDSADYKKFVLILKETPPGYPTP